MPSPTPTTSKVEKGKKKIVRELVKEFEEHFLCPDDLDYNYEVKKWLTKILRELLLDKHKRVML